MRLLVEVTEEREEQGINGETLYDKGMFWLHHWGLQRDVIEIGDGRLAVGNWTVGICEDYNTGQIRCFFPEQIRILGTQIKK